MSLLAAPDNAGLIAVRELRGLATACHLQPKKY
ncbi:hypothetical protein SAMN00120144_3089 [Hymenobacter roseosalivarius DSM 11622]|uniref:Uncharacterized protein n=1 Tax=Hymenobacter roseosalivarius DSM 11622 TaxID=645990 RepID=A0A1W1W502_9BACT|nr:hypothetical protein SAMN00120144_3089 [Hymenobacter roseosalivarius DSM 11622]